MGRKIIIIGASSGIGRELAKVAGQHGYIVGITARRSELLREAAEGSSGPVFVKRMDVSNPDEAIGLLGELIGEMGGVDIVVISAGIGFPNPELEWKKEKDTIDVNVTGFAAIADSAMKYFLKQGRGHLVGISSIAAIRGDLTAPAYSASKAFVSNYLEGLRLKALKTRLPIVVTDIQPGFVDTAMAQGDGLFWVASPEKAARQIFNVIEKRQKHAYITGRWRFVAWILKIVPDRLLAKWGEQ
jgi:short-subunit dehydrogenase